MKSDIDIKDDVWKIIKESSLLREVSGDLKKTSVRPKNSRSEDIIISVLANSTKENSARLRKLCKMSFDLFDNVRGKDFRLSLTDPNYECGQRVIESSGSSEHVVNNKVLYQIINE